jgi:hypothetical protein
LRKNILLAFLLLMISGCAARAQSVSVTFKPRVENLSTKDSLTGVKPCNGINETLTESDSLGVVAYTPVADVMPLTEVVAISDVLTLTHQSFLSIILQFPATCVLQVNGNTVTCGALANSLSVAISASPSGANASVSSATVTAVP